MPQICKPCNHGQRKKIDEALRQQHSLATVAAKYNLSESSLKRHRHSHLGIVPVSHAAASPVIDEMEKAFDKWLERNKMDTPESVLRFASWQLYKLELLVNAATKDGDSRTAIAGISATLKTTQDLFAKYVGLISDAPKIDQSTKVFALLGTFSKEDLRDFRDELSAMKTVQLPSGER